MHMNSKGIIYNFILFYEKCLINETEIHNIKILNEIMKKEKYIFPAVLPPFQCLPCDYGLDTCR